MAASLALVRLVLWFDLGVVALLAAGIAVAAVLVQPRYGLYSIFAIVLLFEPDSVDPLMTPGVYLNKSLQSTLGATGGILIPLEMLLVLIVGAWLARGLVQNRLDFRGGVLGRPMLLFGVALVFAVIRGLVGGAIFNFAFWESRFLFYMVLCYVLAANTLRTRAHIKTMLNLVFVCVSVFGIEGAWRKFALIDAGQLGQVQEFWYSHEDVVIWGLLIMLVFAQQAFGAPRWQRLLGPLMLAITGFTMLLSERRSGYIAVMVAFVAFSLILFFRKRRAFCLISLPILLATAIYLPVFWNNTGTAGQPARAVRSLSQPDPRDAASNVWRDLEAINVRATIASDPLLGIGFGRPFLQVVAVPDISNFVFWNYEAHHDVLWLWMKTGGIGFILFFILMGRGLARSVALTRELDDPQAKVFATLAVCAIIMSLTFCYVDLGLTSSRVPILLGTMLGSVSVLGRLYPRSAPAQKQARVQQFR
ncbi:MAG: O-antigen ligase family protein [Chloroflexota bacterium]|nr:O-antigen ligase family protein [Chloroflexota bacterium]